MDKFKPDKVDIENILDHNTNSEYFSLFKQGLEQYKYLNYTEASTTFKSLIDKFPNIADAYINYGNAQFELSNEDEALSNWIKAREVDKYCINSYVNVGNFYLAQNKIKEGIKELKQAFLINPFNEVALINLAVSYEKLNDKRNAFLLYEFFLASSRNRSSMDYRNVFKKVSAHKLNAIEHLKKGLILQRKKNYRKALQCYFDSIKIYPNYSKTYLNVGNLCFRIEKYKAATEYWLESYKLNPHNSNLCLNLAMAYEKLGNIVDAYCFYYLFIRKSQGNNSAEVLNARKRIPKLNEKLGLNIDNSKVYREEIDQLLKDKDFELAIIKLENLFVLTNEWELKEKANKLKLETNILFKASEFALEIGKKLKAEGKQEKALNSFKTAKNLWPDSYFKDEADLLIKECRMLIANSITAIIKTDTEANVS